MCHLSPQIETIHLWIDAFLSAHSCLSIVPIVFAAVNGYCPLQPAQHILYPWHLLTFLLLSYSIWEVSTASYMPHTWAALDWLIAESAAFLSIQHRLGPEVIDSPEGDQQDDEQCSVNDWRQLLISHISMIGAFLSFSSNIIILNKQTIQRYCCMVCLLNIIHALKKKPTKMTPLNIQWHKSIYYSPIVYTNIIAH